MVLSKRILPFDDPNQEEDDSDHEQDVNKSAHGKSAQETEQPENQENNCDCCKHGIFKLNL